jgi:hypothetical protein
MYVRCVSGSDTVNPHKLRFSSMRDRHPGTGCCLCRAVGVFFSSPFGGFRRCLACLQGDGRGDPGGSRVQGAGGRVGERDLPLAEVLDYVPGAGLEPGTGAAAGPPPSPFGGRFPAQEQVQGGQVCKDPVLAYVRLLRPARIGFRDAGMAVAAPVGGPMKSASLTSDSCAGLLEMTHPSGRFHRCTSPCPRLTSVGVPRIVVTVPSVHPVPGRWGFRFGSDADGHGIPASFSARAIRAVECPASRWAKTHRTTCAVSGSGSSLWARLPQAACALFGWGPASPSRYPYGGRPPTSGIHMSFEPGTSGARHRRLAAGLRTRVAGAWCLSASPIRSPRHSRGRVGSPSACRANGCPRPW